MDGLPVLHELLAHSHLLTEKQRQQSSLERVGPLLCIHAEGIRDGRPAALDRFFASGTCSPRAALLALRAHGPETDHLLFVTDAGPERQAAFIRAGFRLVEVQWLMECTLAGWQPPPHLRGAGETRRARRTGDALLLAGIDGLEPVALDELQDPALTHYYTLAEGQPTAYGRNARYDDQIAWVSHVYTPPQQRGRGYATALMLQLLKDTRQETIARSLLLATAMAHPLYAGLGYRDRCPVAILQTPPALLRRPRRK